MLMIIALIAGLAVMGILAALCSPDKKKPVIIVLGEDGQPVKRKVKKDENDIKDQGTGTDVNHYRPNQPWGGR